MLIFQIIWVLGIFNVLASQLIEILLENLNELL
jgi:hypothetical protein